MYIGAIPTPAATESRQEFTATANQTVFNTTGGTVGYCDCYLNGVKMANSDFSFDGADVTLTTGAAAGDVLAVVMRQADNALVALPITDSAGNNVLSEANNVVSIDSGVQFPDGHVIKTVYSQFDDHFSTTSDADSGLSATINVSSSSNDVLIICSLHWATSSNSAFFSLCLSDNTIINRPDQYSTFNLQGRHHWGTVYGSSSNLTYNSRRDTFSTVYSPNAAGNLTIKVRAFCSNQIVMNRNINNDNRYFDPTGISTMILMEIQR